MNLNRRNGTLKHIIRKFIREFIKRYFRIN
nr:MAG TPA: hypothetical protein [Caudoviricetes sp.]DAU41382.1 MAG TPA: hypothetical protein [Bacteriophage sp.]